MDLQKKERAELVEKLRDLHCDIQTNAKLYESKIQALNVRVIGLNSEKYLLNKKIEDLRSIMTYEKQTQSLIKV